MERIIVRTKWNISYAGSVENTNIFEAEGIVLKVSPQTSTLCFIPKDEIKEIVCRAQQVTYEDYLHAKNE